MSKHHEQNISFSSNTRFSDSNTVVKTTHTLVSLLKFSWMEPSQTQNVDEDMGLCCSGWRKSPGSFPPANWIWVWINDWKFVRVRGIEYQPLHPADGHFEDQPCDVWFKKEIVECVMSHLSAWSAEKRIWNLTLASKRF